MSKPFDIAMGVFLKAEEVVMPGMNSMWFYGAGEERKGPFSKEQMSALLSAGVLNEHSKVWSEALAEWTPLFRTELRALLGEREIAPPEFVQPGMQQTATAPAAAPVSPQPVAPTYQIYDNLLLGRVLYWSLCILAFVEFVGGAMIIKAPSAEKIERVRFLESDQTVIMVTGTLLLVGTVLFLTWFYRATANAFNFAGPQSITPWGAVYWNFVPIAFFWKPFEAMRNLHDALIGTRDYRHLYEWWGAWLVSLAIGTINFALFSEVTVDTTNNVGNYVLWTIAVYATEAVSYYLAAKLIKEMTRAEATRMGSE